MMKALATTVEKVPKVLPEDVMAKTLEDYANIYERADFPKTAQLQETVGEATKARSLLRKGASR